MDFGVILVLVLIVGGGWFSWQLDKARKIQRKNAGEKIAQEKQAYEAALTVLIAHPEDVNARVDCLEKGRAHYANVLPDTCDVDGNGNESNFKDNSAGREARINGDISARTGHLTAKAG